MCKRQTTCSSHYSFLGSIYYYLENGPTEHTNLIFSSNPKIALIDNKGRFSLKEEHLFISEGNHHLHDLKVFSVSYYEKTLVS
jgi:hypothetical protein